MVLMGGWDDMRKCPKCNEIKSSDLFSAKTSYCKPCMVLYVVNARKENPEQRKQNRLKHRLKELEANNLYKKKNKDLINAINRARKARMRVTSISRYDNHNHKQIKKMYLSQQGKCNYCYVDLNGIYHVDHIMPIALGGSNNIENIQILCPSCNLTKGANPPKKQLLNVSAMG